MSSQATTMVQMLIFSQMKKIFRMVRARGVLRMSNRVSSFLLCTACVGEEDDEETDESQSNSPVVGFVSRRRVSSASVEVEVDSWAPLYAGDRRVSRVER